MTCAVCGQQIHYGPAVAALRDENDPALNSSTLNSLAWYHTSTQPDWPSPDYAKQFARDLDWTDRSYGPSRRSFIERETSKALHVGTYESAIENMFRRMDDQQDALSQFYLYRVCLDIDPLHVNAGYRDESHEVAAKISIREMDDAGLSAVLYLNVHEAIGSLSLAVRPQAIAAVQRIAIPLYGLCVDTESNEIMVAAEAARVATKKLARAEALLTGTHMERRLMELGMADDPGGLAKRVGKLKLRYYERWHELGETLAAVLVPHASALVRRNFNDAAGHRSNDGADAYIARYRALAALVEHRDAVIAEISKSAWRIVES